MIKKLRIKFVCVVMAIVILMMGSILGVVIHFTSRSMEAESISMMRSLSSRPPQPGEPEKRPGEIRLPVFTVQVSTQGSLVSASGDFFDLSDGDHLQQIVDDALGSGRETGELDIYELRYLITRSPVGYTIIFSDTTSETMTLRNMVCISLLIFFVAGGVFLGISILLSHWVIKPVEKAWDQQRQFVADASHELKTPLSVIMANAELLQNEQTSDPDRQKFSGNILSMSYQMRNLVENMLEMARVDNGSLNTSFSHLDLSQLVNDALLSFQLLYEEKGLGLDSSIQEGICLQGSEQHLFQVMDVLLDNALKYSTPGGCVAVSLTQSGKSCLLQVDSPGQAIPPEDLKNIFKRFYRVDKARSMDGSYGLGLSIAEAVVEAHKGKIWAESLEGHNRFFVQLPLVPYRHHPYQ